MKKPSLGVIFLTVFVDLIGFGLILPQLPLYAKDFGVKLALEPKVVGLLIGALMSSFSLMQFAFAPIWGRMSDRIGRRPIILLSTAGSTISYAILAIGIGYHNTTALILLFVSRIFAGICGANITVAQAYIADITPPEDRSRRMGLIGMAFGLGFVLGPTFGWLSIKLMGTTGPGWIACILCGINFLGALFILPESLTPKSEHAAQRPRFAQWAHTLSRPGIGLLIGVFFLATFCFACFETTVGLLMQSSFSLDIEKDAGVISLLIAYCGLVGALVQGGGTGKLVKRFGEARLIGLSMIMAGAGLFILPFVFKWSLLLIGLAVFSIGSSLTRPPVFGLLSILADPNEQGATIGVAQSAGSMARILGPLFASPLLAIQPSLPYVSCAILCIATGVFATLRLSKPPLVPHAAPANPVK